ncbi:MAG: hypothetical protein AAFV19_25230, partial [Pseudomonadota bacterium]
MAALVGRHGIAIPEIGIVFGFAADEDIACVIRHRNLKYSIRLMFGWDVIVLQDLVERDGVGPVRIGRDRLDGNDLVLIGLDL